MAKQLRVGICGIGFMGKCHFNNHLKNKGAKVVAMADIDPAKRKGDWSKIGGNIAVGERPNLKGVKMYATCEELIADPEVDVVDITLPTYLHAGVAIKALMAGKPVICEKPMAINNKEAAKMVATAKKYKAPLFISHCIRFWPEYAAAKEIIDSRKYGKVIQASFTRLSLKPTWSWDNWLQDPKRSGCAALDLHVHDVDFIQYVFGMPKTISARAVGFSNGRADHVIAHFDYGVENQLITAEGGWLFAPTFGFTMHFRIQFEKATLTYGCGTGGSALCVNTPDGKMAKVKVKPGDGYSNELTYFLDCVRNGKKPVVVTPEGSLNSVRLVEAEIKSAKANGKPVKP